MPRKPDPDEVTDVKAAIVHLLDQHDNVTHINAR
jgi:hypothetical protein